MDKQDERLRKSERLCSKKRIDALFVTGGSHAMTAFPLKAVYRLVDSESALSSSSADTEATVQVLVSVPKRHFRRAVKRNRVKRQIREAYRKHKHSVIRHMDGQAGKQLLIAFIWLADELSDTAAVEQQVSSLLQRIGERV